MSETGPGFELVGQDTRKVVNHPRKEKDSGESEIAKQFLNLILTTLSQRTVAVVSGLFTALGLALSFWVWYSILLNPTPSPLQLAGATVFSIFVLLLEWVRRRTKGD